MAKLPTLMVAPDILTTGSNLNGRRQSSLILLEAWSQYSEQDRLTLCCPELEYGRSLEPLIRKAGLLGPLQTLLIDDHEGLMRSGGLFVPDPSIGRWARWRAAFGHNSFSLFGQIHTLSSAASLNLIEALASEPVQPWDAVFCSSNAGRSVVEAVINDREQQLRRRFGNDELVLPRPELPVVPLAIPVESLQKKLPLKKLAREALGIPQDSKVCLWLGRLSMYTKTDPWPTYKLLENIGKQQDKNIYLIECGPDDTQIQQEHFFELRKLCPNVNFIRLGDMEPVSESIKHQALAASDLALSLVDNCQETFGLSVAEAMASGLPVVASDWDGYRDSVRNGIDGFLIPSQWAKGSSACSLGIGWNHYLGSLNHPISAAILAQLVQIDITAAEAAVNILLQDGCLRRAMGAAAKKRALNRFSTRIVLQQMAEIMGELQEFRQDSRNRLPHKNAPLNMDPVRLFERFASDSRFESLQNTEPPSLVVKGREWIWELALKHVRDDEQRKGLERELRSKHV